MPLIINSLITQKNRTENKDTTSFTLLNLLLYSFLLVLNPFFSSFQFPPAYSLLSLNSLLLIYLLPFCATILYPLSYSIFHCTISSLLISPFPFFPCYTLLISFIFYSPFYFISFSLTVWFTY